MDEIRGGRAALCQQSGVWLLRRGAGHKREIERQRHADDEPEFHLYELRHDPRRRRVVGGNDGAETGQVDRLAATPVDSGVGTEGSASERAVYLCGKAVPG